MQLSFTHRAPVLASLMWSLCGKPSSDMNSWPQALQNACGVKATSDKALDKAEPHAERVLDRRPESESCTSCRDFCSGERGLKKSKQRLNEINEFLTGKLDPKTHSQFSRGRNKSWAASRCLRLPGRPAQGSRLPGDRTSISLQGWSELTWPWKTTFSASFPTPSLLFWASPMPNITASITPFVLCSPLLSRANRYYTLSSSYRFICWSISPLGFEFSLGPMTFPYVSLYPHTW